MKIDKDRIVIGTILMVIGATGFLYNSNSSSIPTSGIVSKFIMGILFTIGIIGLITAISSFKKEEKKGDE